VALAAALAAAPLAEGRTPQGFFGVMWDRAITDAPQADQEAQWVLMGESGVESVRVMFDWAAAERAPGRVDFARTDRVVALAARHDIDLLPVVLSTPDWAARRPGEPGTPPRHLGDYTAYLRALVTRYGPSGSFWDEQPALPRRPLRTWQIWNEPHFSIYWDAGRRQSAWARQYARLLRTSKSTIESLDPGATIVLGGLADFSWRHLARLYAHRIRGQFDAVAINLFTAQPRNVVRGLRLVRAALRRGGERRKPIWLTETTWPAGKGRVPVPRVAWQRAWYTTDPGMAKRVRQIYALAARNRRRLRLQRVFWYTWSSAYQADGLFDYTGLVHYDGARPDPRPALAAYAASARRLR
jgi:polysaccharide biosynthesis protein PslG